MKVNRLIITSLTLFSLTLPTSSPLRAQSSDEEIRYYDVEVIIFKNLRGPKGQELILPVSSPSKDDEFFDIASPSSIKKAAQKSYQLLSAKELQLHDRVEKIVKSPYYDLLTHVGWRQPGLELKDSLPIWIRGGRIFDKEYVSIDNHMASLINSQANEFSDSNYTQLPISAGASQGNIYELEGKITISLSRYLHTYTDLVLRRPRLSLQETGDNTETPALTNGQIIDAYILDNHRLKEHRRMRSKSLHYLDSPEFAILILITPYKPEESQTEVTQ